MRSPDQAAHPVRTTTENSPTDPAERWIRRLLEEGEFVSGGTPPPTSKPKRNEPRRNQP
jgi:hypothetical protein